MEFPAAQAGHLAVRIEGTYAASDGDVFECVDLSHAEIFVVRRGFQFAVWWGKPDDVRDAERLVTGLLSGTAESRRRVVGVLERELRMGRAGDEGRTAALRELVDIWE
jgi:hypothetical protein